MLCPNYNGEECTDDRCPYGCYDDSGETITCDNCWYYKGCEYCLDDECGNGQGEYKDD